VEYGETLYASGTLVEAAKLYKENLPADVTHLLAQGSSGNSIATAMAVLAGLEHRNLRVLIRRKGESAHTVWWVGPKRHEGVYCIVDDFVDTGETIESLLCWACREQITVKYIMFTFKGNEFRGNTDFDTPATIIRLPEIKEKDE
jgi:phosphoribosylpyrophosphate synthetase